MIHKTTHGIVHGKTIELVEDLGLVEGQQVEITVRVFSSKDEPGAGLLRSEGALANDREWDNVMQEIYRDRLRDRGRDIPE